MKNINDYDKLDLFDQFFVKFPSFLPMNRSYSRVLELGPGLHPRSLPNRFFPIERYLAIDRDQKSIEQCKMLFSSPSATFECVDIAQYLPEEEFDLIIDSSVLHCLESYDIWLRTFQNFSASLSDGGVMIGEMAVKSDRMDFQEPYFYDEQTSILYKDGKINRLILDPKVVEKALLFCGFKIFFFTIPLGLKVIFDDSRDKIKAEDPDVLRYVVVKDRSNRY
ncbi:MAG: hypothetical protein COW00_19310 [Bdellovibrio sp. CG12_big_fil_rev_8_21_14_0_65_39_13]|nr:MAG: hypothetical protein COW78_01380 [Bdellovibrio sp. CG22_combo_CG10-13_8_21_14_all_39_27]PIQ57710.1 MAG: hypothetical protein COW00_19310 [Bdellovibrio sp. CG12_big_fil_rev_8_21_14_0_65_39_13]